MCWNIEVVISGSHKFLERPGIIPAYVDLPRQPEHGADLLDVYYPKSLEILLLGVQIDPT